MGFFLIHTTSYKGTSQLIQGLFEMDDVRGAVLFAIKLNNGDEEDVCQIGA